MRPDDRHDCDVGRGCAAVGARARIGPRARSGARMHRRLSHAGTAARSRTPRRRRVSGSLGIRLATGVTAMIMLNFVLLLLAFLSFVAATVGITSRINLIAIGLALWVLALLIARG